MKTYVIEWRLNKRFLIESVIEHKAYNYFNWTLLEGEEWLPERAASERLKYWQNLSLSKLLEFRVVEVTQSKKA